MLVVAAGARLAQARLREPLRGLAAAVRSLALTREFLLEAGDPLLRLALRPRPLDQLVTLTVADGDEARNAEIDPDAPTGLR